MTATSQRGAANNFRWLEGGGRGVDHVRGLRLKIALDAPIVSGASEAEVRRSDIPQPGHNHDKRLRVVAG